MLENQLDAILKKYFQKQVELVVDDTTIKQGQFLLFRNLLYHNNYFFELHIRRKGKIDSIKIPYPFGIEEYPSEGLLFLDYRNKTLLKNQTALLSKLQTFIDSQPSDKSKFYNKILEIRFS
jgi:hypothetical protein